MKTMPYPPGTPAWAVATFDGINASMRKIAGAVKELQVEAKSSSKRTDDRYVEDIPGTRVPFDLLVAIPIASGESGPFTQTAVVSADGPFVAVERVITFLSNLTFQVVGQGNDRPIFNGRSFGRYRPTHSGCDFLDAASGFTQPIGRPSPGGGLFSLIDSNQHSPFRTMEWDGTVEVEAAGSGFRRQNYPVPSSIWCPGISAVSQLPAMDYFPPTTSINFTVRSNHINNPNAGNIQTLVGALPYLDSQYDAHEGIVYGAAVFDPTTADAITRLPNGILVVGYRGYRIVQPQGMAYSQ